MAASAATVAPVQDEALSADATGLRFMCATLWDDHEAMFKALPAVAKVVDRHLGADADVVRTACTMLRRVLAFKDKLPPGNSARALADVLLKCLDQRADLTAVKLVVQLVGSCKTLPAFVGGPWPTDVLHGLKAAMRDAADDASVQKNAANAIAFAVEHRPMLASQARKLFLEEIACAGRKFGGDMALQGSIMRLFVKLNEAEPTEMPITSEVMWHALDLLRKAKKDRNHVGDLAASAARMMLRGGHKLLPRHACCQLALFVLRRVCSSEGVVFEYGRLVALEVVQLVFAEASRDEADTAIAALKDTVMRWPFDHAWHRRVQALVDWLQLKQGPVVDAAGPGDDHQEVNPGTSSGGGDCGGDGADSKRLRTA
jgi:hypothetical protein